MRTLPPSPGPPVVYLHVGAPKSGTTFLQEVLWHNRRALARDGTLYPAKGPRDHFHAALDLRGTRFLGYDDPRVPGAWQRVVDRARRWGGPAVVISHELLAWASADQARRAVESLRPAEVHVVYTARDLARQIPAMWQEAVKNGRVVTYRRYLRNLEKPTGRPFGRIFWGSQDAVDVLRRWGTAVPAHRVHVVTLPQPGAPRGLLWERFASVMGLDPARYDTDVGGSNVSLGKAEVQLLRRVNRALRGELRWPEYEALVKSGFAQTTLGGRTETNKISLPPSWLPWAVEHSERLVEGLRTSGYDVVGDLAELVPGPPCEQAEPQPSGGAGPAHPGAEAVLDTAAESIARMIMEGAGLRGRARRLLARRRGHLRFRSR